MANTPVSVTHRAAAGACMSAQKHVNNCSLHRLRVLKLRRSNDANIGLTLAP